MEYRLAATFQGQNDDFQHGADDATTCSPETVKILPRTKKIERRVPSPDDSNTRLVDSLNIIDYIFNVRYC